MPAAATFDLILQTEMAMHQSFQEHTVYACNAIIDKFIVLSTESSFKTNPCNGSVSLKPPFPDKAVTM